MGTSKLKYDREWTNDDGQHFYGVDGGDGKTTWYNNNGNIDSITDTPDEFDQDANNWKHGHRH